MTKQELKALEQKASTSSAITSHRYAFTPCNTIVTKDGAHNWHLICIIDKHGDTYKKQYIAASDKDGSVLPMFDGNKIKEQTKFKSVHSNNLTKFNDVKIYKYCDHDNYDENCRLKVETYEA